MKKRIITATAFAACLALCAAVWPQNEPAAEIPAPPTPPAVIAPQPETSEKPEIEEIIVTEKEKNNVTQSEPICESVAALEPAPIQTPPANEAQATPERNATPTQTPLMGEVQATPEQSATPPQEPEPAPASPDSVPDNMVYVPGFGWIEAKAPTTAITPKICMRTATK